MRWMRGAAAITALGTVMAVCAPLPVQADDDGPAAAATFAASPATPGAADPTWTLTIGVPPGKPSDGLVLILPTQWRGAAAFGVPSAIPAADVQVNGHAVSSVRVLPVGFMSEAHDRGRGRGVGDRGPGAVLAEGAFSALVVTGVPSHGHGPGGKTVTLTLSGDSGVQNPPSAGAYPVLAAETGPGQPHWEGATAVIGSTPTTTPAGLGGSSLTLAAPGTGTVGGPVALSAQVAPAAADGTVIFYAGGLPIGACIPGTNGSCGIGWTPASAGSYALTAAWSGDAALAGSQAGPVTISVGAAVPPPSGQTPPSGSGAPAWATPGVTLLASPAHIGYEEFCSAGSGCLETFTGSTSTLVVAVVGSAGQPVPGAVVNFSLSDSTAGSLSSPQCVTGTDGTCAVVLNAGNPSATLTYLVQASGAGSTASATVVYGGAY